MAEPLQIAKLLPPKISLPLLALGLLCYFAARQWNYMALSRAEEQGRTITPPHYESDVLAVGGILAAIGGFFWQPLFQNNVWLPRGGGDFNSFYYPLYAFASRSLHNGIFPFWNPTLYAGMPYAADIQTAALYPPTLLTLWLSNYQYGTLELLVISHYALAAVFMYAFLRHGFGLHRAACILGGLAFAACGFMTAQFGHVPMVMVAAWLPLAMLGAKRANDAGSLRWAVVAGFALAMSALAGHAQIFFYVALTVALWWLWLLWARWSEQGGEQPSGIIHAPTEGRTSPPVRDMSWWLRLLVPPLAAALVFGLLAALQLLMSQELGSESVRAGISYAQSSTDFAAQPIGLLNLFLPHVWGSNPQAYWSLGNWANTETWSYCGVITIMLAILACVGHKPSPPAPLPQGEGRREGRDSRWFFVTLAVVSLLLTLGGGVILYGWLFTAVPEWNKFRSVGRLLLPFSFALATLAGFGAARLLDWARDVGATETLRRAAWVAFGSMGVILGGAVPIFLARVSQGTNVERSVPFVNDFLALAFWLAVFGGLLWYAQKRATQGGPRSTNLLATILLAALILDLFSVNAAFNPTEENNTKGYQHQAAIDFLKADPEHFRIDSDTGIADKWQPSLAAYAGLEDASGVYNPLKPLRYDQVFQKARLDRNTNLYGMLNIKYVIGLTDTHTLVGQGFMEDMQLKPVFSETGGLTIYRNLNALPRAYIVHRTIVEPDAARQYAFITSANYSPRKAVVLDGGAALTGTLASSARYAETSGANPDTGEAAMITAADPNTVVISATVKQDGYLVLADVDYPGWGVQVDGQTASLQRANYAFRAVRLAPGQHTVTMQFTPRWWWPGLAAVALGLLLALLLLIFGERMYGIGRRRTALIVESADVTEPPTVAVTEQEASADETS